MKDKLFKELCKHEVIRVGWHLAQRDSRDDFVTDPISHADFAANLTDRLEFIIEQVQTERYRPKHLLEIDIPKSGLSVRPGNVLPIEEASLLHAMVYLLAPLLDKKLNDAVYSYRLHPEWKKRVKKRDSLFREVPVEFPFLKRRTIRSVDPFEAWYEAWPDFEKQAIKAAIQEGFTHLTKTDISAYFENIDLNKLEAQMRTLLRNDEERIMQMLFRVLRGWTRTTTIDRGIPQGNEVSSFLGNLYLIPLDEALTKFCKSKKAKWFRYVDDVKVFTRSERDAREAVFLINKVLRDLHLNLQGSKTRILSGESLKEELDNSQMRLVGDALEAIQKLDPKMTGYNKAVTKALEPVKELVSRFRCGLPGAVADLSGEDSRLFRRLLTLYGCCQRPRLIKSALCAIEQLPELRILRKCLTYLYRLHPKTHQESVERLLTLVESESLPFPYQVGEVFAALSKFHPADPKLIASRIRKNAFGGNLLKKCDWYVAQKALEAMFTYPYRPEHCKTIADHFIKHPHPLVRRATCLFVLRSPAGTVHKTLAALSHHPDPELARAALYFSRLHTDRQIAQEELAKLNTNDQSDSRLLRSLPQLYAVAASEDKHVAAALYAALGKLPKTRSPKVQFHRDAIMRLTDWAVNEQQTRFVGLRMASQ